MIKGARQVGKTFLIREFGRNEYESFIEINFIIQKDLGKRAGILGPSSAEMKAT